MSIRTLLIAVLTLIPALSVPAGAEGVTFASLLREMCDRDALAKFPEPAYQAKQASSYNRLSTARDQANQGTGGWFADSDGTGFIRTETINGQQEWVVMEHAGPGALTRFWTPFFYSSFSNRSGPRIHIYLDGSTIPVIDQNFIELLTNLNWSTADYGSKPTPQNTISLPEPFSNFTARAGVLHLPVPFAASCKVTLTAVPFYNIISYRAYPAGTAVTTFSAADLTSPSLATTGQALQTPANFSGGTLLQSAGPVPAGGEVSLTLPAGAGALRHLEVDLDAPAVAANPAILRSLALSATFDGEESVWCPVGDFFCSADRLNNLSTSSREVVATAGKLTCRWVMPFQTSGRVRLLNHGSTPVAAQLKVRADSWTWDASSMHFHANWRADDVVPGTPFIDWNFIDVHGKGVFVGDAWTVLNLTTGWWGEGDEKIYVDDEYDGAKFPTIFGTGTEDYYGWAGGVNPTRADEFATPYEANVQVGSMTSDTTQGFNVNTRTRVLDAIPFQQRLVFDMEASAGTSQRNAWNLLMYSSAVFWYALPGATSNRPALPADAARPITSLTAMQAQSDVLKSGGVLSVPGAIEAEGLTPTAGTAGVVTAVDAPAAAQNPSIVLSGGKQRLIPFTAAGQYVEFRLTEQFAPCMLRARLSTFSDRGKVDVSINGAAVLKAVDLVSPSLNVKDLKLGLFQPQNSAFTIRITCSGPGSGGGYAAAADAFVLTPPAALQATAIEWRLGEDDAGAANGGVGKPLTNDRSGTLPLACAGSPVYQTDVPAGGSSLSMKFPGTAYYTGNGTGLFAGIDFTNFEISFDAKPTSNPSFHVAVSLGRYGVGCAFIYLSGTTWRYHVNGLGDRITGPAGSATLNQWQNVKLTRKGGVCSLYVNGTLLGTATDFPTPSNDFTIAAAKTGTGTPDGRFIGLLDNVRLAAGSSGYGNAILNQ